MIELSCQVTTSATHLDAVLAEDRTYAHRYRQDGPTVQLGRPINWRQLCFPTRTNLQDTHQQSAISYFCCQSMQLLSRGYVR